MKSFRALYTNEIDGYLASVDQKAREEKWMPKVKQIEMDVVDAWWQRHMFYGVLDCLSYKEVIKDLAEAGYNKGKPIQLRTVKDNLKKFTKTIYKRLQKALEFAETVEKSRVKDNGDKEK